MSDHASRRGYDSDLTDAQWELVEPLLPPERGGRGWGRPLIHPRREIVNAILYMARAGCSWRQLPGDLPPWATVYDYFATWKFVPLGRVRWLGGEAASWVSWSSACW